ncbi:MAG: hypothetical protein HY323_08060 [Betaproteobacteria bacterium]|nr:hypothetical protein [Betaproteobacteria bacterium]
MPDIKGIVTKKIGPAPVWVYVVVGAGLVFLLSRRGGSAGAGDANVIRVPTFAPGPPNEVGAGAAGSPSQNVEGGTDTQPGGARPWWADPPSWWSMGPTRVVDTANTPGGGGNYGLQSAVTAGPAPATTTIGKTAGALAAASTPGYTQTTAKNVAVKQPNGAVGGVAPSNVLVGTAPGGIPIFR